MASAPSHVDLWPDRALIVAPLGGITAHRHAAAALLVGVDGPFRIGVGRWWRRTEAAFVPAGVAHALECGSGLIGVCYLFPFTGAVESLVARWQLPPDRISTGIRLPASVRESLRDVHAGTHGRDAVRQWVTDALLGGPQLPVGVDPRLVRAAAMLRAQAVDGVRAEAVAEAVGLSASRLMRFFQAEGVTLRRYRQWERMRLLTAHVAGGDSLTMAGLAAGFADSAHLSHSFRAMFGSPPSRILNRRSRLRVR